MVMSVDSKEITKCGNGKYRVGNGKCVHKTLEEAQLSVTPKKEPEPKPKDTAIKQSQVIWR
jgi:hypothetical protein